MTVVGVTGGRQGIGRAIASAFEARGDDVAILDIADGAAYRCDVSRRSDVERAVDAVESDLGPVDVFVNNAGFTAIGPSEGFPEELWQRSLDVMVTGVFFCCQVVGQRMLQRRRGSIINISSINATEAFPQRLAYCAAKAAVSSMTRVLAIEWADRGVRVNAIAPGVVRTEMVQRAIAEGHVSEELYVRRTPMRALGTPEEIARAALYLADGGAESFVTGTTLVVDGGWTAYGYL
jgi:NAD(P)-dependent dehydrogenase (short-subunit alcohol dehydrogenase family)